MRALGSSTGLRKETDGSLKEIYHRTMLVEESTGQILLSAIAMETESTCNSSFKLFHQRAEFYPVSLEKRLVKFWQEDRHRIDLPYL